MSRPPELEALGRALRSPACRGFLLGLPGGEPGDHSARCVECAVLQAAYRRQVQLLHTVPRPPAELRTRAFYESILDRTVAALESDGVQSLVRRGLGDLAPVSEPDWPAVPAPQGDLPQHLEVDPATVPAWRWRQLRQDLFAEVTGAVVGDIRRSPVRRALPVVASLVAVVFVALLILARPGTPDADPGIVMQRLSSAPFDEFSAVSVLRSEGRR